MADLETTLRESLETWEGDHLVTRAAGEALLQHLLADLRAEHQAQARRAQEGAEGTALERVQAYADAVPTLWTSDDDVPPEQIILDSTHLWEVPGAPDLHLVYGDLAAVLQQVRGVSALLAAYAEAAPLWGSAQNPAYTPRERLTFALQTLDTLEPALDALADQVTA